MKIIRICLMGLVMILSATLNADVRQYHFSHLTMDDGCLTMILLPLYRMRMDLCGLLHAMA